jgi:hypothetical protein
MSSTDFERVKNSTVGFLAFNSFLFTNFDKRVSLGFAREAKEKPNTIGILFQMIISPSISSSPYASFDGVGYYRDREKEILFSMYTIFRIENSQLATDGIWNIHFTFTDEVRNPQFKQLTVTLREEIGRVRGWHRLANVPLKKGDFTEAKEIYQTLLSKALSDKNEIDVAYLHHYLAHIYVDME